MDWVDLKVSIIIRALNEEAYLANCLEAILTQTVSAEIILVDSQSTDATVDIAESYGCKIISITRDEFTFGRALNLGVAEVESDYIVSISAHCVPQHKHWLEDLLLPLQSDNYSMSFGSHRADPFARTSEVAYFMSKFSGVSRKVIFPRMNNGNAAFKRSLWLDRPFNEFLVAQEDMDFCDYHLNSGHNLYYCNDALVTHYHNDTNKLLFQRLLIETKAELYIGCLGHSSIINSVIKLPIYVIQDLKLAYKRGTLVKAARGILLFRGVQTAAFITAYVGFLSSDTYAFK